ncbi:uncharacterized protein BJX67DRAFT_390820 [Aspergillus lucknowensis]|uniref:Uncharacterized protein n=1 Tax=Aspergillus lucknowensis TaxID=176173 RepID=A0ABR4LEV3_9EURO
MGGSADHDTELTGWPDDPHIRPSPSTDSSASGASLPHEPSGTQHRRNASTGHNPGTNQQSQSKNFEFVLVTDNESRRQVRRHAMRQYMHQRRIDSIARLGAPRVPAAGWAPRPASHASYLQAPGERVGDAPNEVSAKQEQSSPSTDEEAHPKEKGKSSSRRVLPKPQKVKREHDDAALALVNERYSNPISTPENGAVRDPFSSYPIAITDLDHELIQHFVVTYPSMMYRFIDSTANKLNPMKEIFRQLALHDELPFQAMLAIASKHRAGVEGKAESVQSLTHKMRALRLMNKRIHMDLEGRNDGTIYAVATMAVIEKWSKDASIERMHFRGLASMIRNRGGMQAMHRSSSFLEKVLYWVDLSCAPKAIIGTALPWTSACPDSPPTGFDFINPDVHLAIRHDSTAAGNTENLCDEFRACEDFLRFFRHLHELERTALNSPSTLTSTNTPRRKAFTPGTKLYSIITHLPDYDHGIRDSRFIDEYTRMSCLFFLAVSLYHSYSTSTTFDAYLQWLQAEVDSLNPYENPSITSILWLFLQNDGFIPSEKPANHPNARCWVVSRMVRIAKHLEWKRQGKIWDTIRQVLIEFLLTQQECALGEQAVDAEALASRARKRDAHRLGGYFWNEDELRLEILDAKIPTQMELGSLVASGIGDLNIPILT